MRRDSFYKRIDPPSEAELCRELKEALAAMRLVEDIGIAAMGLANVKAPEFVCVLDRVPSPESVEAARAACACYPHVNVVETGIGCAEHWSDIDWEDALSPPVPEAGIWSRLGRKLRWRRSG